MILLYDSAIRVSELTGLHITDVNLDTLSVHVHGKGNKERSVAFTAKTAGHLKLYKSIYLAEIKDQDHWLFFTTIKGKTGRISTGTIERLIQKYANEARTSCSDMPERVYPHLLRAERATHLYRDGIDSIIISKILGHASVETTKIYALPSMDQMREALNKVDLPSAATEQPLWMDDEDELARLCGLK
jgi:site-specific recombinase XerD